MAATSGKSVILAMTGASGSVYAIRLLDVLLRSGVTVHLSISDSGKAVLEQELDVSMDLDHFEQDSLFKPKPVQSRSAALLDQILKRSDSGESAPRLPEPGRIHYHHYKDLLAPLASGSFLSGGMVICPCSGTTLSAVAHATAGNLIQRAAEVQLKERRRLILVPRETPLSTLQLENMLRVSQAGAVVLPASPGWYHGVERLSDLVDFVVARICDQLGVENALIHRWGE